MVYLSGDRIYIGGYKTLNVYSIRDLATPIGTYQLNNDCCSCIIVDNHLYVG